MEKAIIGKKVGMTQIFDADGKVVPVTVIEAGPCSVVQKKTAEKDGYEADSWASCPPPTSTSPVARRVTWQRQASAT